MDYKQESLLTNLKSTILLFSFRDKRNLILVTILQIFLSVMDLLGVALIGVFAALSFNGLSNQQSGNRLSFVLELINLENFDLRTQAIFVGLLAAFVLVIKTFASLYLARKILFYLSRRTAIISIQLLQRLLNQPFLSIFSQTSQSNLYAVTSGVSNITLGLIGTGIGLISDISLLIVMIAGLAIVNVGMTLFMVNFFILLGLALYLSLQKRARKLGEMEASLRVKTNEAIVEVLSTYRESTVRNTRQHYANKIGEIQIELSDRIAESKIMGNLSKYLIDFSVVIGATLLGLFQLNSGGNAASIGTISIFLASATRIAPAVFRIQQSAITMKNSQGSSKLTFEMLKNLPPKELNNSVMSQKFSHENFVPKIELEGVYFQYEANSSFKLQIEKLKIEKGQKVAIVGPSGSGKTTLADLILGIIEPDIGNITISTLRPSNATKTWPGAIGYVPQDSLIVSDTIRNNVGLGYEERYIDDYWINRSISMAGLSEFIKDLPKGIETFVGEGGLSLSGGQKQRLSIARCLYTNPSLIILDEATSSLDGETESEITEALNKLRKEKTLIFIAHRLSTIRDADLVIYMDRGKIIESGEFEYVRKSIPNFDRQASLMGL